MNSVPRSKVKLRRACVRAAGGLCVADEVQVGFRRVGSHWWAFEAQDVVPDVVTMGKPIGPCPVRRPRLCATRELAASFNNGKEYFTAAIRCRAVLDVIKHDPRRNATEIAGYLVERFRDMQGRHEAIGDVRGMGLFLDIEPSRTAATSFRRPHWRNGSATACAAGRADRHGRAAPQRAKDAPAHDLHARRCRPSGRDFGRDVRGGVGRQGIAAADGR